ncbi:hypothetical protein PV10_03393 [Exophiala mesophila]|uniref:Uncharacterized protein n=1 Tax=Exophiala mesophila TaxID=212818 RepID=A0A0D2A9Z0_EXOME|nr:uncharacterized protein PV10_03393 [Exophiala mesophila]KIV95778.1 hypothetical protein PV10_03393 [Exophiala mesophila]
MHLSMRRASSLNVRSILLTSLLSSPLIPRVSGANVFSYFQLSSCNAGTAFYQYSDPNNLVHDINCHQVPNGTVAMYIDELDEGCTLRTYTSKTCSPSELSGVLITPGTCFYADHAIQLGSWRADCIGADYSFTNGDDTENSWTSDSGSADGIEEVLGTATGPVTITEHQAVMTKTVVPVRATDTDDTVTSATSTASDNVAAVETGHADVDTMSTTSHHSSSTTGSASRSASAAQSTSTDNAATAVVMFNTFLSGLGLAATIYLMN